MSDDALARDFVRDIVEADRASGALEVVTRFPPEPNGYLHIGHVKSAALNFGIAAEYPEGRCYLRFDDTNPARESEEYVESMKEDLRWLGFSWEGRLTHASDYFEDLFELAMRLVRKGRAYVDEQSPEEIRASRGTLTEPGRESPSRHRAAEENEELLLRMREGEFPEGSMVLRAKIDMASPNLNLRDPVMYRILHRPHQNTGRRWCIYPMYDWAHGQCDYLEGVTHSLCTLEFEDHRALYDWFLEALEVEPRPRQYEFARLNLDYTVLSKRTLIRLVDAGHVDGWDDPRMPTLRGMRRRGYPPAAIREFCRRIGVTRKDSVVEIGSLEHCVRAELDSAAPRAMCVMDPLKLVIVNYPEDREEMLCAPNHPRNPEFGRRELPFSREIWIERGDFMAEPAPGFFRLAPGREVRLRFAWLVTCVDYLSDEAGEVREVRCTYDPDTRGGSAPDGRKIKGALHWVCARRSAAAEVRLFDRLFTVADPAASEDLSSVLNPESRRVVPNALVEASLAEASPGASYQFERQGYFCADAVDSAPGLPVFNRIVTLRDTWAKRRHARPAPKRSRPPGA